nr:porin [Klebsiella variicola]
MEKNGLFSQRIRLRHLHTFVAVAQQGTLGRAAETLNLSQPALSKTLNELEQLTGTRLFERGRLGAQLTLVGEQFLTHAVKVLDALNSAGQALNRKEGLNNQKADGNGDKAEAWATSAKYDANNVYAAVMYSQTYNMTPEEDNHFAGKTQNFEAVVQYQFDFGLRPSIGYVQTKGKDLQSRAGFSGGDADLVKYIEVGTWYYFNKNMNVYAAYKFNQLDDNDYTKAAGVATDDQAAVGIVYQF